MEEATMNYRWLMKSLPCLTLLVALTAPLGCSDKDVDLKKDQGPSKPTAGTEGGPCYPNNTCNVGLTCASKVCVRISDAAPYDVLPHDLPLGDIYVPPPYPSGPYGSNVGDVMKKYTFQGFRDPKEHCTELKNKKMNFTTPMSISNEDWYKGELKKECAKYRKKILWITVVAGWDGAGTSQTKQIQNEMNLGTFREDVGYLTGYIQASSKNKAPDMDYLKGVIKAAHFTMPLVADPKEELRKLFPSCTKLPMNMLVDLKTMKIQYKRCGGTSYSNMDSEITKLIGKAP